MDQNEQNGQVHEDKVVNTKSKHKLHKIKSNLPSDKKRLFLLILIILAIPLTVGLVLVQQEMRSRASELTVNRVFLTSSSYNGNLGGLAGADAKCQASANNANLGGTWKAWLSDGNTSAGSRLIHSNNPYKLLNGITVSNNWIELTDGAISQINVTEMNEFIGTSTYVWTNTKSDGSIKFTENIQTCNNWNSNDFSSDGGFGESSHPIMWTDYSSNYCGANYRLYCIEQGSSDITPTPVAPSPTMPPLTIKVTSPNGEENLTVGQTYRITWDSSPDIDKVMLGYSFGEGSLNNITTTSIPNTGYYDWNVNIGNLLTGSSRQVKIDILGYDTGVGSKGDQSDNFFTVTKLSTTPATSNAPTPTAQACVRKTPFITVIEPLDGNRIVTAGESTFYKFWIRNDNSSECPVATYKVGTNVKSQYISTESVADVTLSSGESQDIIVYATTSKGAPAGTTPISVAVWDYAYVEKPTTFSDVNLTILSTITPTPGPKKVILYPNADAFVRSSAPNQNFGTAANLENDLSPDEISYIRFNLSTLAGKTIKSAKLVLYVSDPTKSSLNLRNADDSDWSETGITYNKRPAFVSTLTSFNVNSQDVSVGLNVTNRINSKKGTKVTFGIKSLTDDSGAFHSRNTINSTKRPQLVVEYY